MELNLPMLKSLQILRFIAATSVVYYHITFKFGSFGVDIFFVLSGFVIALVISNKQNPISFAISRISRIVPIYWLLTSLLLLIILLAPQLIHQSNVANASALNYLRSLFFIPFHEGVNMMPLLKLGWTLNYEMFFYFLVWISLIITRYSLMLVSILLIILFFTFEFITESRMVSDFFGDDIILEFVLGIIAFKIYTFSILKRLSNLILIFIIVLSYFFMAYIQIEDIGNSRLIFYGLPSFLVVLSCVGLEDLITKAKSNITSFFVSMGDASYATYLTHWYVVVACRKIFSEKFDLYNFYSPIGASLTLVISLIIGQFIYKYLDSPLSLLVKKYLSSRLIRKRIR